MTVICVAVFAVLAWVAIRGLKRRSAAQAADVELGALVDLTALAGKPVAAARGQYVATVFAAHPLERVVTGGLMHRGKAQLVVTTEGVGIERIGEESFAIAAKFIKSAGRASHTIDRGVETDGLLAITWTLGNTAVTTLLRIDGAEDNEALNRALQQLVNKDGAR